MAKRARRASVKADATVSPDVVDVSASPAVDPSAGLGEFAGTGPVLIAAAECAPLVKSGGLADVAGALPAYLAALGIDARVIMPYHGAVKAKWRDMVVHLCDFHINLGWRSQYVGVERLALDGVTYYLIDNEFYFGGPVYCGGEFEGEQYCYFTRAVVESIPRIADIDGFFPRLLHCNDWHTACIPLLLKTQYQGAPQGSIKTLLTIHNLAYQGTFSHEMLKDLLDVGDWLSTPEYLGHYGCDDMLKGGIVFADRVNTVSPSYAREICTPTFGEGLDGILRARGNDLAGILNGIDDRSWDPSRDAALPRTYSRDDRTGKAECKRCLLDELGLEGNVDRPLIAMVGRLTPQKGIDLVLEVVDDLLCRDASMVVLGSGDAHLEDALRAAESRHRGRMCSYIGYNGDLSRRIYAGSDLFLMPSAFEPCGISQMLAMRYGSLPVVRETGGLVDTVIPYNRYTGEGTGFSFANYDAREMLACLDYALATWHDAEARARLVDAAMGADFGFARCAREYARLYREL